MLSGYPSRFVAATADFCDDRVVAQAPAKETFKVDNNLLVDGDTRGSTVRIGLNLHLNPVQREVPLK